MKLTELKTYSVLDEAGITKFTSTDMDLAVRYFHQSGCEGKIESTAVYSTSASPFKHWMESSETLENE